MNPWTYVFIVAILVVFVFIITIAYYRSELRDLREECEMELDSQLEEFEMSINIRIAESLKKSKDVIRGSVSEELAPLFKGFPYQMSDCKFSGQPLDYMVFNGMSASRDNKDGEIEIVFADVKSGNSTLNTVQRRIRDAIKEGRVRFETWIINNGEFTIK